MAEGRLYTVIEADYLDQLEGIVPGACVTAEEGTAAGQLLVTATGSGPLDPPVAVYASQLAAGSAE